MNKQLTQHLEASIQDIRGIFTNAITRIEAIKMGERYPAVKLAGEIGAEFGLTAAQAYPFMRRLLDGYPNFITKAGRFGGIQRVALTINEEDSK